MTLTLKENIDVHLWRMNPYIQCFHHCLSKIPLLFHLLTKTRIWRKTTHLTPATGQSYMVLCFHHCCYFCYLCTPIPSGIQTQLSHYTPLHQLSHYVSCHIQQIYLIFCSTLIYARNWWFLQNKTCMVKYLQTPLFIVKNY